MDCGRVGCVGCGGAAGEVGVQVGCACFGSADEVQTRESGVCTWRDVCASVCLLGEGSLTPSCKRTGVLTSLCKDLPPSARRARQVEPGANRASENSD